MNQLGLIGYPLSHSFSRKYFSEKFEREDIFNWRYELFELPDISKFTQLITSIPNLRGLNVTIPHKKTVIPYLDQLSPEAAAVGAVNTIAVSSSGLKGYNTDIIGFELSLSKFCPEKNIRALILGTGGAAAAVKYVLDKKGIISQSVSRTPSGDILSYTDLSPAVLQSHRLIINTSPLGMYPNIASYPPIPYELLDQSHYLMDLVYNPEETSFMSKGKAQGALVCNGMEMLIFQAEAAWKIWNENL